MLFRSGVFSLVYSGVIAPVDAGINWLHWWDDSGQPEVHKRTLKAGHKAILWILVLLMGGVYWWTVHLLSPDNSVQAGSKRIGNINSNLREVEAVPWKPNFLGYDFEQHWQLQNTEKTYVSRYVYLHQKQGKELIYYSNEIANKYQREVVPVPDELYRIPVNGAKIQTDAGAFVVLWSYKVGPWFTASELGAKLLQLPTSFLQERSAELLIAHSYCGLSAELCNDSVQILTEASMIQAIDRISGGVEVDSSQ